MSNLSNISLPSKPYPTLDSNSDPIIQKLESIVLKNEERVKNPSIEFTEEEFKKEETNIERARKAVTERLAIINELHEIEDKTSLVLPFI